MAPPEQVPEIADYPSHNPPKEPGHLGTTSTFDVMAKIEGMGDWINSSRFNMHLPQIIGCTFFGGGLVIIYRSSRYFKRFRSFTDYPESFVTKRIKLKGFVRDIRADNALMVQSIPIVELGLFRPKEVTTIPLKLSGCQLDESAEQWMKKSLIGQHVWFVVHEKNIEGEVLISDIDYRKMFLKYLRCSKCVNVELVELGYAQMQLNNKVSHTLAAQLTAAQEYARSHRKGMWSRHLPESPSVFCRLETTYNTTVEGGAAVLGKTKDTYIAAKEGLKVAGAAVGSGAAAVRDGTSWVAGKVGGATRSIRSVLPSTAAATSSSSGATSKQEDVAKDDSFNKKS